VKEIQQLLQNRKGERSQVRAIRGRKLMCKKTLKHCIDTEILGSRKLASLPLPEFW